MKQARSIVEVFALLIVSFGLDWAFHSIQDWTSLNFVFYPQIIFRILANLFIMLIALIFGLALAKDSYSRLVSLVMVIAGLCALILPLLMQVAIRLGFMAYYLSSTGALLVLTGIFSVFRHKRPIR